MFGVIFCSYGFPDLLEEVINPWIELKDELNIKIAATSGLFKEYNEILGLKEDDVITQEKLKNLKDNNKLDYLYIQNPVLSGGGQNYQTEFEIRNKGLQWLLSQNIEYIWLVDSDELITKEEILKTAEFIKSNPLICWFRTEFKNLVFDESHYISGFKPPRIFKVNYNDYQLNTCIYDNDFSYKHKNGEIINHQQLPSLTVGKNRFFAIHYTWLNNENSKRKVLYQEKRWNPPNGNGCGFKWNNEKNCLEFNLDYYQRVNQSIPELLTLGSV